MPFSKITDGQCSTLQKGGNIFDGVTTLKIHSDWMLGQCNARLFPVRLQSRPKIKRLKRSGS
jgi:hypothetical protein